MRLSGASVFPLTPIVEDRIDKVSLARLVRRCAEAGVDSIVVLGSTGCGVYLTAQERGEVIRIALDNAGDVPVFVGISALRSSQVQGFSEEAQRLGADGVLLAPVSYQKFYPEEVFGLYQQVTANLSVPLIVYDNPRLTHFSFTENLYQAVAQLPHVASIKIPGVPTGGHEARTFIERLKGALPDHVTVGVSGDSVAAAGLKAGCDLWYSVIGGVFPRLALAVVRAAQKGDSRLSEFFSMECRPLWDLFDAYGSLRVVAAIAEHAGLVSGPCLPLPLQGLAEKERAEVKQTVETLARLAWRRGHSEKLMIHLKCLSA